MKNNKLLLSIFAAVAIIQLAVPLYMAWHWENILQTGQRFYWQTAPVDPYDAFKGRYIDLQFKENTGQFSDIEPLVYGQTAFALIEENAAGKAYITAITGKPPEEHPYIKVKINYIEGSTAHIQLPFKRYYLPENIAAAAESAYRQNASQSGLAAVRIKDGYGVIEELYIGDKTLTEYLRDYIQ